MADDAEGSFRALQNGGRKWGWVRDYIGECHVETMNVI